MAQAFSHPSSTQLETLLQSKKDKIKNLKAEIKSLQVENASLKAQINKLQQHKPNENENDNDNNLLLINELQSKIKQLTNDNENKDTTIKYLEKIKSEEIDLMNQKIKDFELMLNENSTNYVKDISQFRTQIDNYRMQILHYEKYVDVVNYFISKIHLKLHLNIPSFNNINQSHLIKDITELQDTFFQIEMFINEAFNIKTYYMNNNMQGCDSSLFKKKEEIIEINKDNENEVIVNQNKNCDDDNNIDNNNNNVSQKENCVDEVVEEENKITSKNISSSRKIKKTKKNISCRNSNNDNDKILNQVKSNKSINKNANEIVNITHQSNNNNNNHNNNVLKIRNKKKKKKFKNLYNVIQKQQK